MSTKILIACSDYYPHSFGGTEVYIKNYATYLKEKRGETYIITSAPITYFTDKNTIYVDKQIKVCKYLQDDTIVFGVCYLTVITTNFIHSKTQPSYQNSWTNFIQQRNEFKGLTTLHIQSFTPVIGLDLFKAVIQRNKRIHVITSYHTPISCTKSSLMYGKTLSECQLNANLQNCSNCLLKTQTQLPYAVAKSFSYLNLKHAKFPTVFKTRHIVKLNINAFQQLNEITKEWWCYSDGVKNILQKNKVDPDKIKMVRHGISKIFFTSDNHRPTDKTIYLFSGRLTASKGVITLLKTWLGLSPKSNKELWITASPSSTEEAIQQLIEQTKSRSDILFLGEKNQLEIAAIYTKVHFVIIPSEWFEIGPLVFHEAMASKCNVICSDIGGCKELAAYYKEGVTQFKAGNIASLNKSIANSSYVFVNEHASFTVDKHFNTLIS